MALSSERAGRKPPRRTAPSAVAPPALPTNGAGAPPPDGSAAAPKPPMRLVPSDKRGLPAAGSALPAAAPPAIPDASEMQSIPLMPLVPAPDASVPQNRAPNEPPAAEAGIAEAASRVDADKTTSAEPAATDASSASRAVPPRRKNLRFGWLIVLLLLLLLGVALFSLFQAPTRGHENQKRSVADRYAAARTRIFGWFGQTTPAAAPTNASLTVATSDAVPRATSPLAAPIRQARKVIAAVHETREERLVDAPPAPQDRTATSAPPPAVTLPPRSAGARQRAGAATVPSVPPPAKTVDWPGVEVSAIVGIGRRGSAIVNGDLIRIGEENEEGLVLDRIESQSAVLKYQGETRRFMVKKR
jgi:hypothetical protein